MHHSKVKDTVLDILSGLDETETVMLSVCGTMSHLCGLPGEYITGEIIALETGALKYYPQAESIIMIGAQNTLYAEKEKEKEWKIRRNSNCSSGTGSFFEEQAGRLGIRLEDISSLVKKAKTVPHIAGRCSVFSKTDMIHHMQEGTPAADLLLGICYSLVRKAFHFEQRGVKLLMPELSLNFGKKYMINSLFSLAEEIDRAKIQMIPAVMK